jgi:heme oxygenase (biliverdin-producing, ferredoxin)
MQGRRRLTQRSLPLKASVETGGMTAEAAGVASPSAVTALYLRTRTLHVEAERSGIIRDLLRGEATREGYLLLLRNLLPAYQAMEQGLARHRGSPALGRLADYRLDRAPALEADLVALCGAHWSQGIPLLAAGDCYARRIAKAAEGDGTRLIAHAYTRYLGDLSGGQILQRLLARSLDLQPAELSFYDFSGFSDLDALKADYRQALDDAGAFAADRQTVIEEGAIAFSLNIDLSCAVKAMLSSGSIAAAAVE